MFKELNYMADKTGGGTAKKATGKKAAKGKTAAKKATKPAPKAGTRKKK